MALPNEDPNCQNMCALLARHMYGTRCAADGWQEEYSTTLVELGFVQGMSSACVFVHRERGMVCTVHGDDFTTVAGKLSLDWFEDELKKHYELTVGPRLGPGDQDATEATILNRVIRWTAAGMEYEADPRQAQRLVGAGREAVEQQLLALVRLQRGPLVHGVPQEVAAHCAPRVRTSECSRSVATREHA